MENAKDTTSVTTTTATTALFNELQNRLLSLKRLQSEYARVENEFHRQFYKLDMEYQNKRQAVYNRRKQIINGAGDTCINQVPTAIDIEIVNVMQKIYSNNKSMFNADANDIKGIPGFWLRALKNCVPNLIRDCDEAPLNHLIDIKLNLMNVPELSFKLEFEFAANAFFKNATLTKQYFLNFDSNDGFNGFSIHKTIGCNVEWNDDMDVTEKDTKSFFLFFNPPDATDANEIQQQSNILVQLQHDFETGLVIKEKLIPNAVAYYLTEAEEVIECSTLYDCDETLAESMDL